MSRQDNRELLDELFGRGAVHGSRGALLDRNPDLLPTGGLWDRVEGMMLGLAVGDSLANTTAGQLPAERAAAHGEIRDYIRGPHTPAGEGPPRGLPSESTQLAFWTLEQLMADRGRLDPEALARRFSRQRIFGISGSVREFLRRFKDGRMPWYAAAPQSAGAGAVMRMAPILIPRIAAPLADLWVDAVLCAMVTHNDSASISSCVALVAMLWDLLGMRKAPPAEWWIDTFVRVVRQFEDGTAYRSRAPGLHAFQGSLSDFTEDHVRSAWSKGLSAREACDTWHSGAYLLETMPSVLAILMRHASDPEEAIVRAVNDTKDNHTVAAIVGCLVGALHGRSALPPRWIERLSGRTADGDDGRVFEILDGARELWCAPEPPAGFGVAPSFDLVTRAGLDRLLRFLPAFEHPEGPLYAVVAQMPSESGPFALPYHDWSETLSAFVQCLYQEHFIVSFPWQEWRAGARYEDKPELIDAADLRTLQAFLTRGVRGDRFVEGYLCELVRSGVILRVLKRLAAIVAELDRAGCG